MRPRLHDTKFTQMTPTQVDQRLDALETKLTFAEDTLDQLNLTVYRQQQQIDRLLREMAQLRQQLPDSGTGNPLNPIDEIPPHY